MKKRIYNILTGTTGETLVETVVSIFVFAVFMLIVATVIKMSARITSISARDAKAAQEDIANRVILSETGGDVTSVTFRGTHGISASHDIRVYNSSGLVAFAPDGVG